jgi:hypothetical protein
MRARQSEENDMRSAELHAPRDLRVGRLARSRPHEIELRGTFGFQAEFALAVALIGGGLVDVMSLLSVIVRLADARAAFELTADRSRAVKVQLAFR